MISKNKQSAQTKKTQNKALSDGVPVGWREACPPQNWRRVKLGDVAEINPLERLEKNSIAKKIPMEALEPFQRNISFFLEKEFKGGVKFRNGDTLVARITPSLENGKTAFVDVLNENEVGFGSTEFIVLRKKENITDEKFIYYLARSFDFRELAIKSMTGTSGRQRVQTNEVINYRFLLPPLPEQKAIAEALSSLDDKIDLLHRQNKTLENMAQALFRKWFIDETDEGWEIGKLSDIVDVSSGKGLKKDEYIVNGKYSVLGANGKIGRTNKYLLDEKVIFTGRVGTLGNVFIFDGKVWLSDNTLIIKPKAKHFYFVYFLLKTKNLKEMNVGSTQPLIRQSDLKNIAVFLPPKNILQDFENKMGDFFVKIDNNQSQICTLENLRDTLLPKLMSGEVRVKDFTK